MALLNLKRILNVYLMSSFIVPDKQRKMTLIGIYAILCLFDKIPQCQKTKKQETITSRVYSNKP